MTSGRTPKNTAKKDSTVPGLDLKEALRQSEVSYHDLFNTIRQAIYIEDADGRFIDVNDGACAMYGYTREEFIGRTPEFLAAPGLNDFSLLAEKARLAFTGEPQQMEFWGRRKNGEIFPKDVQFYKGTYFGSDVLIVVATDITEQKRTEKALRESESRYRAIIDTVPDNITITDLSGKILMVSPASIPMFGFSDLVAAEGRNILEFVVPEDEDRARQAMTVLIKMGVALGNFCGKRIDGTVFPLEVHGSLMRDRQGNPWRMVLAVRDISVRRHLEETLSSALARSYKQQQVISEIAASPLISSGDVEKLSIMITEQAAPLLGVGRAGVWIFDDLQTRLECIDLFESTPGIHTSGTILLEKEFRNEFAALKSAKFINADDSLTDPRTAGYVEGYLKPLGITSMLDAVIRIAGKNLGLICFEHVGKQHTWEPDEITFACQLADQIALAVTNRERNRAQQELFESEERFRTIIHSMQFGIIVIDAKTHTILEANKKSLDMIEAGEDEVVGSVCHRFICPAEYGRCPITDLGQKIDSSERVLLTLRGEKIPILKSVIKTMLGGKEVLIESFIDISDRKRAEEELRESQERFQGLVETMYDWVWEVDCQGHYTYSSPRIKDILGYEPEEMLGKTPFDIMPADEARCVSGIYKQLAAKKAPIRGLENTCLHKDGHTVILETNGMPFYDARGTLKGYRGTDRDITGRKRVEAALAESESFNRGLVENLPDYVSVYGEGGILLYVNPASANGLGYDADALVGTHVLTYVAEEYRAKVTAKMTARQGEGDTSPYEIDMVTQNGSRRSVIVKATPIQYRNKPAILLLLIDITDRRKVEEALRESEEKFRLIVENSYDILYTLTAEGVFSFVSPAWTMLLGHPVPLVIGQSFQKFVHPDDIPGCQEFLQSVIGTGKPHSGIEYRVQHNDGTWRWHTSSIVPLHDKAGRITGGEGIARDITERKRSEIALRESEERYRHLLTASTDYIYSVHLENGRVAGTEYGVGCLAVTGYSTRDFRNDPCLWHRMVVEEDRAVVVRQAEQILSGGEVKAIEHRIVHKNGGIRWVRNTPVIRHDPKGRLIAYDGLIQDVTERKLAELALLTSKAQLNAIIRASPIPMFVIDRTHKVISWNKALESTTGIESRTMIGTDLHWTAFYLTARPCLADILADGELEKIPELYDNKWKKSENIDGAIEATDFFPNMGAGGKWLHFMAAPIIDIVGNLVGVVETLEDITHLVRAQQELKESEERYRTLIDQLPDYVLVHRDGILLYVNPSAAARMGYDAATLIGKPALQFIAPEYHDTVRQATVQRMTDEGYPSYEVKILSSDGTPYTVLVNGAIINYGGKPASLNVLTDITILKKAEEAIRSANEDLDKRVTERTEALILANEHLIAEISARTHAEQEITSSLNEKNLLLREIHHRVKNNLQIIASLLNLQSRYISDEKVLDAIKDTQSRVRAMALAHEQIYRSDNIADINLKNYLNYLTKQIFQFYSIKRFQIAITVTMDDIMANLDTVIPVGLIVNELVSNSLKHAFTDGSKGMISLTCTPQEVDRLRFVYHDNGNGMPVGFDWKNTETLGLRLVNGLVHQLNGTVQLEPGEGTTFVIEIQKNPAGKTR